MSDVQIKTEWMDALLWSAGTDFSALGTNYGGYTQTNDSYIEFTAEKGRIDYFIKEQLIPIINSLAPAHSNWCIIDLDGYGKVVGIHANGRPVERIQMGVEVWNTWNAEIVCGIILESDSSKTIYRLRFTFCPFEQLGSWFCDKIKTKTMTQYPEVKVTTSKKSFAEAKATAVGSDKINIEQYVAERAALEEDFKSRARDAVHHPVLWTWLVGAVVFVITKKLRDTSPQGFFFSLLAVGIFARLFWSFGITIVGRIKMRLQHKR